MRRIASIVLVIVCLFSICFSFGCDKASNYTEEEHIARITERIKNKDFSWALTYESFEVYPLYNQNEEVEYFLVEFEPFGFMFVNLRDTTFVFCNINNAGNSMYKRTDFYCEGQSTWSPYSRDKTTGDKVYFLDENGEKLIYTKSPYYVTQNMNSKKYLIETSNPSDYICAIKKDEVYLNLISGSNFDVEENLYDLYHATIVLFSLYLKNYDL